MKLLEPQGLLIIMLIVLVIFGPKQLPELGKMLGKTMKSVREGMEGAGDDDDEPAKPAKKIAAPAETVETVQAEKEPEFVAEAK
ncbi:MAG: twin-arginine translocase TatA/TatE family subunit [Coriobacteriia bacterium]